MVRTYRRILILLLSLILNLLVFNNTIIYANKTLVYDDAMLFTDKEVLILEDEARDLSNKYNMDIVIVTTDYAEGKSSREYADDFFNYGGFGVGGENDGILFLIDMDNGEAYISTSGIGIRYLTDMRIEKVLDVVFDDGLLDGDYYGATMGFIKGTKSYLEAGIPSDQYNEPEDIKPKNKITLVDILIGIIGGLITSGLFYFTTRSRYKTPRTYSQFSYRNNSIVNLESKEDKLVDTFITHRIIPKPSKSSSSSTSGRSTTHQSSSGKSHGGGGRKF